MKNKKSTGWVKFKHLTDEQKRIVKAELIQLFDFKKYSLLFFKKINIEKGEL